MVASYVLNIIPFSICHCPFTAFTIYLPFFGIQSPFIDELAKFMKEWYSFGMTSDELYDRLLVFAKDCQMLVVKLPNNSYNVVYSSQLIRSSSSPGANYIEALEASSKKRFYSSFEDL